MMMMGWKWISLLALWSCASVAVIDAQSCPGPTDDPLIISDPGADLTLTLSKSTSSTLCVLLRVTRAKAGVSLTSITRDAPTSDYFLTPVSRSYENKDWERVAGPWSSTLEISSCNSAECTLDIPHISSLATPSRFVLMSFSHSLTDQEQVSRFLWQASFGPTLSLIQGWNYSGNLRDSMAFWIQTQMDASQTTPTYHRSYFRQRASHSLYNERPSEDRRFVPVRPCDKHSTWREFSFTTDDFESVLKAEKIGSSKWLLSVDDVPRTIVTTWKKDEDGSGGNFGAGTFEFCWWTEEVPDGYVSIYDPTDDECYLMQGGNPPVRLDDYLTDETYSESLYSISLPAKSKFGTLDPQFITNGHANLAGTVKHLKNGMWSTNSQCDLLGKGDFYNLVGVFPDGSLAYFNGNIDLHENTLENPLIQGGDYVEAGAECPNVAMNWQNAKDCVLSTSGKSCSLYGKAEADWILNDANNKRLHDASGRYIYTVEGLRTDDVSSPCTLGETHRWVKVDVAKASCTAPDVNKKTRKTLSRLLEDNGWDSTDYIVDVNLEWESSIGKCKKANTIGMMIWKWGSCWQHSHPDLLNVYDMTYWTIESAHPGNVVASAQGKPNPIKKWIDVNDEYRISLPSGSGTVPLHLMAYWENNKGSFDYIGRYGDEMYYENLPSRLRIEAVANEFGVTYSDGGAVVVCGSPNEVSNDPLVNNVFYNYWSTWLKDEDEYREQKKNVWNMIALEADDQLRQRVAWALSQTLVITPNQIDQEGISEVYLNYYDIFVKHAFGSYFDILKEVSYSAMMAEMLSYLESKGSAFVLKEYGVEANPDENFAREIMQLFSMGIWRLNMDGTPVLDETGNKILTYENKDIQNFARAWTGFERADVRSNMESGWYGPNRIDPMKVTGRWRDPFPKTDLLGGYIGDSMPLCEDLPSRFFLRKSAQYRLLGSRSLPDSQYEPEWWLDQELGLKRISLSKKSKLRKKLCKKDPVTKQCTYPSVVTLKANLKCNGAECKVDQVSVVKVSSNPDIYYEYVRPACVDLSFYDSSKAKKISKRWPYESMCANKNLAVASDACCENEDDSTPGMRLQCMYTNEKVTYAKGNSRCKASGGFGMCDWYWYHWAENDQCSYFWNEENWHWTDQGCEVLAKVNDNGEVALVHEPNLDINDNHWNEYIVHSYVNETNTNYFNVPWKDGNYPSKSSGCSGECKTIADGCLCSVNINESAVFDAAPSVSNVLAKLKVGSVDPSIHGASAYSSSIVDGVEIHFKSSGSPYDTDTIFGVEVNGEMTYYKNVLSTVKVAGTSMKFRNPPSFINLAHHDSPRDAQHETDAVLKHYFHHPNVAPFLATMMSKRFGISNPSPTFIETVATAFKDGTYSHNGQTFGDGTYGSMKPLIAALLLDDESRSATLDSDTSSGSLKEPMLKVIGFMRAMEFEPKQESIEVRLLNLQKVIGQMPHAAPNVFSYFLPEYSFPGNIKDAELTSPEAQVLNTPKIIGFLNGIISLVDLGLTGCFGGFGDNSVWECDAYNEEWFDKDDYSRGFLQYSPTSGNTEDIIDELALLLTAGKLNQDSRAAIKNAYDNENTSQEGLQLAQKLITTSPEFHSLGVFDMASTSRPEMEAPQPSTEPYKAIVIVFLDGGIDSHNILVPVGSCSKQDMYENYASVRRDIALPKGSLHQIDATSSPQECDTFGIHSNLPHMKSLYDEDDLLFIANVGLLQQYCTKYNWWEKHRETSLFAHNIQQEEANYVDIFDQQAGRGVGGRMVDILLKNGYKAGTTSVRGTADALAARDAPLIVLEPGEEQSFNPNSDNAHDVKSPLQDVNKATSFGSSLFSELWSHQLYRALGETELLNQAMNDASTSSTFPRTDLGEQLETIAKLIKTKDIRGVDHDVFYASIGGFDTHANIATYLNERTTTMNGAMEAFTSELKDQAVWDQVTTVYISEFARTLVPNTGAGSDHAWGGNMWITGGAVKGGKILGKYPSDLSYDGDLVFPPGIVIPTYAWETMWNPVAEWFGIDDDDDLNEVLPNRNYFSAEMYSKNDFFD